MSAPRPIRRLDETVVNRIAAGEVVQRPANALKELLENSLDAKSTNIVVTVKDGGMKMLQVQDNGTGVRREDLELVCERFATSKLQQFEDLLQIGTYGFRGEALASITHVAHLTITTRTADSKCAYKARYSDSRLLEDPRPCAGNVGTQLLVEDLFFNMAVRKQALRSPGEEFSKVAEVVQRYAVHNSHVGFTLKKQGSTSVHLRTPPAATQLDNIRNIYGGTVARDLTELNFEEPSLKLRVGGYISSVNYQAKKLTMLLFINHRLVESSALRQALEETYTAFLPRHTKPFLYLSLQLAPETVDVNVHPTKSQVHFLHEDRIIELIQKRVDALLLSSSASRTMYTQTLLPGVAAAKSDVTPGDVIRPKEMVRNSYRDQKLDQFVKSVPGPAQDIPEGKSSADGDTAAPEKGQKLGAVTDVQLTSVLSLREEVESGCDVTLRQLMAEHTFVGVATEALSLVQHETRLYLVNHQRLAEQLFYQICLYQFGECGLLELEEEPLVSELAMLGLSQAEAGWTEADGPRPQLAQYISDLLVKHAVMLDDYFSLQVSPEGRLRALPLLLDGFTPPVVALPMFLIRLSTEVNWDEERDCLHDISREIAKFYSWVSPVDDSTEAERQQLEHALFPALKEQLLPQQRAATDGTFLQVADLPDLYKVFERC